jgi:hypothetical protein
MFSISSCPHCGQQVLISAELHAECLVRCPICEAEFPLGQALANAVDAPPELTPVARVAEEQRSEKEEEQTAGWGVTPSGTVERTQAGVASQPTDAAFQPTDSASEPPVPQAPAPDHEPTDAPPDAPPAVSPFEARALWQSRQKPESLFGSAGKAIAIAAGGLLGIAVAYLALSVISPRRFDFLNLWGQNTPGSVDAPRSDTKDGRSSGPRPKKFDPDHPSFGK